jgi:putative tryptophan/tyrosine transport system substrate-binding protein
MRRRELLVLGGAAAVWPRSADAQAARKPLIGLLFHSNPEPALGSLRSALAAAGYREGDTAELDIRVAGGSEARLSEMAAALVGRHADVIIAVTTPAALAAKAATGAIPIVMGGVADPIGSGLVASLSRPGGNVTGFSAAVAELAGKLLELLREALPAARRIGVLVNPADPFHVRLIEQIEAANWSFGLDVSVHKVAAQGELAAAFEAMLSRSIDAAIIQPTLPRREVISLAIRHRLPTAGPVRGYSADGGLLSYSGTVTETYAVVASLVDHILKGAKPADIPVRQPVRFELVLNLKTARSLGIEFPPTLLARADEVIE